MGKRIMYDFLDALYDVIKFYVWMTGILAVVLLCYYFVSPYQNCKRDFDGPYKTQYCIEATSF